MNCLNKTKELFPAAARGAKKLAAALSKQAAGRWALRFFAAMVVLTLAARGISGAGLLSASSDGCWTVGVGRSSTTSSTLALASVAASCPPNRAKYPATPVTITHSTRAM